MSIIPAGFTRLDNETDVITLLSLPNALAQPYLFLLTRARLKRPAVHWGEVAAAINRSQTQTHAALRSLKALGLADESAGMWLATRREVEQKPAEVPGGFETETRRKPADNPTETPRKPAMSVQENAVPDEENQTLKEGTEGKKEQKEVKDPPTPQGEARESAAPVVNDLDLDDLDFAELLGEVQPPDGGAADAASPALAPFTETQPSTPEGEDGKDTSKPKVPRRAASAGVVALPDDLAAVPGMPAAWERWQKYTREAKLKLTESTAEAQFKKLRALLAEGRDLPHHVDHAIEVQWRSFFPIRGENQPRQNLTMLPPASARRNYDEPAASPYPRRSYE